MLSSAPLGLHLSVAALWHSALPSAWRLTHALSQLLSSSEDVLQPSCSPCACASIALSRTRAASFRTHASAAPTRPLPPSHAALLRWPALRPFSTTSSANGHEPNSKGPSQDSSAGGSGSNGSSMAADSSGHSDTASSSQPEGPLASGKGTNPMADLLLQEMPYDRALAGAAILRMMGVSAQDLEQMLRQRAAEGARRVRVRQHPRNGSLEALTEDLMRARTTSLGMGQGLQRQPTAPLVMRCYYIEQEIDLGEAVEKLKGQCGVLGRDNAGGVAVKEGNAKDHMVLFIQPAHAPDEPLKNASQRATVAAAEAAIATARVAETGGPVQAQAPFTRPQLADDESHSRMRAILLYDYGAVAFVNCSSGDEAVLMQALTGHLTQHFKHWEETTVVVRPEAKDYYAQEHDCMVLKEWDYANLEMIARVLGQSTGMSYYNARADVALQSLHASIDSVEQLLTRSVLSIKRTNFKQLMLRSLHESSHLFSRLVFKLRVMERSKVAWESSKHDEVWRGLREDYEVLDRFELLEKKVQEIKEQSHFLMDLHQSKVSERYEFIITALISIEIVISCLHYWR